MDDWEQEDAASREVSKKKESVRVGEKKKESKKKVMSKKKNSVRAGEKKTKSKKIVVSKKQESVRAGEKKTESKKKVSKKRESVPRRSMRARVQASSAACVSLLSETSLPFRRSSRTRTLAGALKHHLLGLQPF